MCSYLCYFLAVSTSVTKHATAVITMSKIFAPFLNLVCIILIYLFQHIIFM